MPLPEADRWRLARLVAEVGLPIAGAVLSDEEGKPVDARTLMAALAGNPCNQPLRDRIASARPYLPELPAADAAQKVEFV